MQRQKDIRMDGRCAPNAEVLIALVNQPRDLEIARNEHWYRIPVASAEKWLRRRWPPQWLAFYQPKSFGADAFAIHYCAPVIEVREVFRRKLLPHEPNHPRTGERYYQLMLGPLEHLAQPIRSRRRRRIVFISTTWRKFRSAMEINDLYDESPLEDLLWEELKRRRLAAERKEFIAANGTDYALDFALYCKNGNLGVETDGDTWHGDRTRIPADNRRDNDLETGGWKLLRFNTYQLREEMTDYCVPTIVKNVQQLGGLADDAVTPRNIPAQSSAASELQMKANSQIDAAKKEIVVFIVRRDTKCAECGEELGSGRWLRIENDKPLCMTCADLAHLEFLASGNTALTRRATKYSPLRAVVVQWARARKRYERQGILVTREAIDKAEAECVADEEQRARQRERATARREVEDGQFIAEFTDAIRQHFPGCPPDGAATIARHACQKHSGRVGRSPMAKEFDPQAIHLAVAAHVRHEHTNYDELLMKFGDRRAARDAVRQKVEEIIER
jgi:very-short-patch-repair endonuclease